MPEILLRRPRRDRVWIKEDSTNFDDKKFLFLFHFCTTRKFYSLPCKNPKWPYPIPPPSIEKPSHIQLINFFQFGTLVDGRKRWLRKLRTRLSPNEARLDFEKWTFQQILKSFFDFSIFTQEKLQWGGLNFKANEMEWIMPKKS